MRTIFYDTETTGLEPKQDRIIEIAAYDPDGDRSFVCLINPNCPIPAETSAIHRITDEMVKEAPPFDHVAQEFTQFCGENALLIAHNNDAFDAPFLKGEFQRCNIPFPSWQFLDSLKWARRYRPDLPRHALQFLREIYDIPANQAHRALDDVIVLYQVFKKMTDDLDTPTILKLLTQPTLLRTMPFGKFQGTPLKEVPQHYIDWLNSSGMLDKEENNSLKYSLKQLQRIS